ncbi:alpha/beta fold hydrolase [Psychroserpens luteolus]|uniref:alpha/beta fold hydrolase n=1 Tax=Psychroserpens luteolus TaxID=2855840 RepID=UPI001E545229|nr:alpha/beta hydrolase [Psychroserpens luteolus]MCD2260135.1 alpha/beta hydrolase [Psychroserpens luteolus]
MTYTEFKAKQQFLELPEGRIAYIDEGHGAPILLLHGVPTSGWLYRHIFPELVQKGYRVIVPDMFGYGSSDSPKGYEKYHEKFQAERLSKLMEHLSINKWTHMFHDAGGLWTWELLKQQPKSIKQLIILNTIILKPGFTPPMRFGNNFLTKFVMNLYSYRLTNTMLMKGLFKSGLLENNLSKDDIEGYKMPLLQGKIKGMYYFFSKTCHNLPDYSSLLPTLEQQVLVIWGKHDEFLKWEPQQDQIKRALNIKTKNIHVIEGKHFIQEEIPEKIINLTHQFIQASN